MERVRYGDKSKCSYCGGEYEYVEAEERIKRTPPPGALDLGIFDTKVVKQIKCTKCGSTHSASDFIYKCIECEGACWYPDRRVTNIPRGLLTYAYITDSSAFCKYKHLCLNCFLCDRCGRTFADGQDVFYGVCVICEEGARSRTFDIEPGTPFRDSKIWSREDIVIETFNKYVCSTCAEQRDKEIEKRQKNGVCLICGKGFLFAKHTECKVDGTSGKAHVNCVGKRMTF